MPSGRYLRTNYRRNIGQVKIDGIGGGIPKASAFGGAGTTDPYGGFIWLTICAPVKSAQAGQADGSGCVCVSTHDLMASFYGAGLFTDGYAFQPVFVECQSLMTAAQVWALQSGLPDDSTLYVAIASMWYSGSYALWRPLLMWRGAGANTSHYSFYSLSYYSGVWQVGGFIVSGPGL